MNSSEILQENTWFVCVINHVKSLSLWREECGIWCVLCSSAPFTASCPLPKRLLILCKVLGEDIFFWVYTFTDLKTEIHWPLHYCNGDNCTKTVPHRERKRKEVLLVNFRNSRNKFRAGPWSEINTICIFPNNVTEYWVEKSRIFFKNLNQTRYPACHSPQASNLLQALHWHAFTNSLGKLTKKTLLRGNLMEKDKALGSSSSYIVTWQKASVQSISAHTSPTQMSPFPYKSLLKRRFKTKTTQSPLQVERGGGQWIISS